jgi:hypothetical protein
MHHIPRIRAIKAFSSKRSMVAHTTQTQGTQRISLNDISKCQKTKFVKSNLKLKMKLQLNYD